jgi:hypothetical protein
MKFSKPIYLRDSQGTAHPLSYFKDDLLSLTFSGLIPIFLSCRGLKERKDRGVTRTVQQRVSLRCCGTPSTVMLGPPVADPVSAIQQQRGMIYPFQAEEQIWLNDTLTFVIMLANLSYSFEGDFKTLNQNSDVDEAMLESCSWGNLDVVPRSNITASDKAGFDTEYDIVDDGGENIVHSYRGAVSRSACSAESLAIVSKRFNFTLGKFREARSQEEFEIALNTLEAVKSSPGLVGCQAMISRFSNFMDKPVDFTGSRSCNYESSDPRFQMDPCCNQALTFSQCCVPSTVHSNISQRKDSKPEAIARECNSGLLEGVENALRSYEKALELQSDPSVTLQNPLLAVGAWYPRHCALCGHCFCTSCVRAHHSFVISFTPPPCSIAPLPPFALSLPRPSFPRAHFPAPPQPPRNPTQHAPIPPPPRLSYEPHPPALAFHLTHDAVPSSGANPRGSESSSPTTSTRSWPSTTSATP